MTLMKTLLLFLSGAICLSTNAQIVSTEFLNGNNVNAAISNNGVFFRNYASSTHGYKITNAIGDGTIYNGSIWCGAEDINGIFHVSKGSFSGGEEIAWGSGPIADPMYYGTPAYQNAYGTSIWKVTRQEVENHLQQYQQQGYVTPQSILDWPGNGETSMGVAAHLAPFVDLNNDGIYNPADGDYPDFPGREVVYTIVNDKSYLSEPDAMGLELHLMFYQFYNGTYLDESTFLNVRAFNRSTSDYFNFKIGFYLDMDIGNFSDDFIGCDSTRNMFYTYNADQFDEDNGGVIGYGTHPPCQAVMSLNQPLTSSILYGNYPLNFSDTTAWNYLNGLDYSGNDYINPVTNNPTKFMYSGNPYTQSGWYMGMDTAVNVSADLRGFVGISPGDLPVGTSTCSDFVFIYNDADGNLENVQNVLYTADALQNLYDSQTNFPCAVFTAGLEEKVSKFDFKLYPNPSSGLVNLEFTELKNDGEFIIRDMSGREVLSGILSEGNNKIHLDEKPGVYMITVSSGTFITTKKLIIE